LWLVRSIEKHWESVLYAAANGHAILNTIPHDIRCGLSSIFLSLSVFAAAAAAASAPSSTADYSPSRMCSIKCMRGRRDSHCLKCKLPSARLEHPRCVDASVPHVLFDRHNLQASQRQTHLSEKHHAHSTEHLHGFMTKCVCVLLKTFNYRPLFQILLSVCCVRVSMCGVCSITVKRDEVGPKY